MSKRLAYLVGAKLVPQMERDGASKPRAEYSLFAERNQVKLLDYRYLEECGSGLARRLQKRGVLHVGLAAAAARVHREYDGFVTSGEDVGLPLAVFCRLRGSRSPIYIITHGSYFGSPKLRWLLLLLRGQRNVHFLCLSDSLRNVLVSRFGVPSDQVHNAGYGVDTEFFNPRPTASTPLIASAGTATRDYRTLVKAVERLTVPVKIAVDSAWFPMSVDIQQDALPDNVEARSYGDYNGLRDLYASASFVVVPLYASVHACGFAVIIEAMAMGKTVIATRTEAHSDFIVEGETGFYVPHGDVGALRASIENLLQHPDLAREMGQNARSLIEREYSLAAYCKRMERIAGLGEWD